MYFFDIQIIVMVGNVSDLTIVLVRINLVQLLALVRLNR